MSGHAGRTVPEEPRPRRVTIADVAREANVSPTTVSHSFSGAGHVNAETRARVKEVAARIKYRPSVRAQRLRAGRSQAIAVLSSVPSAVSAGVSRLGFFTEIAMGCAQTALLNGYVFVLTPPDQASALDQVDIDGAILLEPLLRDPIIRELNDRGIPHVTIGAATGPDNVDLHHRDVADLLLDHLIDSGARMPGLVLGSNGRESQRAFRERYLTLSGRAGFPPVITDADEAGGEPAGYRATAALLAQHPEVDALCVPIDAFATGAAHAAAQAGRTIGKDLLLATRYDGVRAQTATPQLTAVNLHLAEVSDAAVTLLLTRLGHTGASPTPDHPSRPTLVVRASTAARARHG